MSYTLRGRLESRLAAALLPLAAAAVLAAVTTDWWPLELAGVMLAAGLTLDAIVYDRLLPYQPGWVALPLGLLELGIVMAVVRALAIDAPLAAAVGFFAGSWLIAQLLAHAGFPLWRLSYAEDGGELGRPGPAAAAAVLATFAFASGVAWAGRPPTVHLSAGVHAGPLVIRRSENVVGAPGAVVRGGIVIRASHVVVRGVTVTGGEYGIEVDDARHVLLDDVTIGGAALDGIHVRRSSVHVRDCRIRTPTGFGQGIDISFASDLPPSTVEGCDVRGGREGIVTHFANVMVRDNVVSGTSLRAITLTEMSMGTVDGNSVRDALGVGIFCGDHSQCMIEDNRVTGTRSDTASGDLSRAGFGIVAHYGATAELEHNRAGREAAFSAGRIERR